MTSTWILCCCVVLLVHQGNGAKFCHDSSANQNPIQDCDLVIRNRNFNFVPVPPPVEYCIETIPVNAISQSSSNWEFQIVKECGSARTLNSFNCLGTAHSNIRVIKGAFCGIYGQRDSSILCCCPTDKCNDGEAIKAYLEGSDITNPDPQVQYARTGAIAAAVLAAVAILVACITLALIVKIYSQNKRKKTNRISAQQFLNGDRHSTHSDYLPNTNPVPPRPKHISNDRERPEMVVQY